eukprot:scaffold616_cov257-Pinguiococcus_pyrenoidosus.AAC.2
MHFSIPTPVVDWPVARRAGGRRASSSAPRKNSLKGVGNTRILREKSTNSDGKNPNLGGKFAASLLWVPRYLDVEQARQQWTPEQTKAFRWEHDKAISYFSVMDAQRNELYQVPVEPLGELSVVSLCCRLSVGVSYQMVLVLWPGEPC